MIVSYKSILVNLDIDGPVAPITALAADLCARFNAEMIGFCAADAALPVTGPEGGGLAVEAWQQMRGEISRRFKEVRAEFERAAGDVFEKRWLDALQAPTRGLIETARVADLIVVGAARGAATGDGFRAVDPSALALSAGRPILIAADGATSLRLDTAIVAWKDTREARRAVADAVPLLQAAGDVVVVSVAADPDGWVREGVRDVAAFLTRHGLKARHEVIEAADEEAGLVDFVMASRADLVVSGAFGHSRFREWVFGGVTRSLLDETALNRFMSS